MCVAFNWNGTVAWTDPAVQTSMSLPYFPYSKEVLTRFWVMIDPDMDTPPNGMGPKLWKWGDKTPNEIYAWPKMGDGGMLMEASNGSINMNTFWGSAQSRIGDHNWHKVEQYMQTGNPGTITLWVDGVQVNKWSVNTDVGGTWYPLWFASNWSGAAGCCDHDASNHMYVDDVEVYTDASSGISATGSLADATVTIGSSPTPIVLAAPAGLYVVP
jgi:hypothetical protein